MVSLKDEFLASNSNNKYVDKFAAFIFASLGAELFLLFKTHDEIAVSSSFIEKL